MKYFYSNGDPLPHIDKFTEGSHVIYVCEIKNYVFNAIRLEEQGWEIRDCFKILQQGSSKQALLMRKSFEGTIADNVIKNGCGGINIDACRIGNFSNKEGRFPSNLLLECTCEEVIKGENHGVVINNKNSKNINDTIYKLGHSKGEQEAPRMYKDEGNIHTDENCPCYQLDLQSGITKALKTKKSDERVENNNQVFGKGLGLHNPQNSHNDSGGASRFFFSYENEEELDTYLTILIKVE